MNQGYQDYDREPTDAQLYGGNDPDELAYAREQVQCGANPDNCAELQYADDPLRSQVTDAATALRFMLAGNAYFTLVSKRTGTRFTYRVGMPKKARGSDQPWYYVSLLNGPDNTSNYTWMGTILNNGGYRYAKVGKDAASSKAFLWLLARLQAGVFPAEVEFWHEGRCGRCGRMLTVPASVARGIGPECAGRL